MSRFSPIPMLLGLGLFAAGLNAQDPRGQIVGRVVGPTGAVVAGGSLTINASLE